MYNTAYSHGGAIHASTGVTVMITSDVGAAPPSDLPQSQFVNNRATGTGSGGALYISANSIAEIASSLFISNSAFSQSGAVGTSTTSSRFVNVVAAYNTATRGLEGFGFISSVTEFDSCTIAYNGDYGIRSPSFVAELENCIVWGHAIAQVYGTVTARFCDIQYGFPGNFNITNDPLFADPSMFDFQLSFGSPCIDAGTTQPGVTNDCIGKTRPYGGGWDIGAYEYIPEPGGVLLVMMLVIGKLSRRKR
jgi:predicted outer membrane repeat protein